MTSDEERGLKSLRTFVELYGTGRAGIIKAARVKPNMTSALLDYHLKADAGNAALLLAEVERIRAYAKLPLQPVPLEMDYAAMERRYAAALSGVIDIDYGYRLYPKGFDMFEYLNVTARTYKAHPPFRRTRIAVLVQEQED